MQNSAHLDCDYVENELFPEIEEGNGSFLFSPPPKTFMKISETKLKKHHKPETFNFIFISRVTG